MKTVILAGGYGTRIAEESVTRPKPMIDIGGMPIIWHIMKHYYHFGHKEFIIAANFKNKGYMFSEFFKNYSLYQNDIHVSTKDAKIEFLSNRCEDWSVSIIDTGDVTETAGRIKRLRHLLDGDDFLVTYGDGVSDININKVIDFHKSHGKCATMCVTSPTTRFGSPTISSNGLVTSFAEKPNLSDQKINIGYFVFKPKFLDYIESDSDSLAMLDSVARSGQLMSYMHDGFWRCMDTLADMRSLRNMYSAGNAEWILW